MVFLYNILKLFFPKCLLKKTMTPCVSNKVSFSFKPNQYQNLEKFDNFNLIIFHTFPSKVLTKKWPETLQLYNSVMYLHCIVTKHGTQNKT